MIDERQYRRPEFDEESVPVEWPDVGTFHLPRPRLVYRRGKVDGRIVAKLGRNWGVDYEALVDRYNEAKTDTEFVAALFALAEFLLDRNYDLPDEVIDRLLVFEVDPTSEGLPSPWDEVSRIALSLPPKSNAVG